MRKLDYLPRYHIPIPRSSRHSDLWQGALWTYGIFVGGIALVMAVVWFCVIRLPRC